jgi:uncharacterized membrane protein YgcG
VDTTKQVTLNRWTWDRASESVDRVLRRAKLVTWASAAVASVVLVSAGWATFSGILRESAIIYGVLAGVAVGYVVRGLYVTGAVRRAVAPVKAAVVPALVPSAREPQLVGLLVNGGTLFGYQQVRVIRTDEAVVEIGLSDLAAQRFPRPGFFQLLMTGADGSYYDDGSGTMDGADADGSGGAGGGGGDFGGGDFAGGDFGGGGDGGGG